MASLARSSVEQTFTCEVEPQIGSYSYSILNTPLNSIKNLKTKNQKPRTHLPSLLNAHLATRNCSPPQMYLPWCIDSHDSHFPSPSKSVDPLSVQISRSFDIPQGQFITVRMLYWPLSSDASLSLSVALRNTSHDYSFNIDRGVGCFCTSRFIALYDLSDDTGIGVSLSSQRGHTADHLVGWHGCQEAAGSLWVEEQRVCVVLGRFVLLFTGCLEEWENK